MKKSYIFTNSVSLGEVTFPLTLASKNTLQTMQFLIRTRNFSYKK